MPNVQPGFGFICEIYVRPSTKIDGGKVVLEEPWAHTTEISKI